MKILHLFSNWKWTGPAEPALNLCLALKKRGHEVAFACGASPEGCCNRVAEKAIERGLTPVTQFKLKKHFSLIRNVSDFFLIKNYIKEHGFNVVHTHMPNDHLVGGLAAKRNRGVLVVRTSYSGIPLNTNCRNRFLFSKLTDGLVTISENERRNNILNFNLPESIVKRVEGPVDLQRFDPANVKQDLRETFGINNGDVVVGVVARVQWHRQFDLLLKSITLVKKQFQGVKLLIIGRGTNINDIAVDPIKEMDIKDNVIFSGYRNEDYVDVLDCMDIKMFLVPGSDGSCRAVREAMAMGKPVIASKRGILPELVLDGKTGFVVNETPGDIAEAILRLINNKELRESFGKAARERAVNEFDLDKQAADIERFYCELKNGVDAVKNI